MSAERDSGLQSNKSYSLKELIFYLDSRAAEDSTGNFSRQLKERLPFVKDLPETARFMFDAERFEILVTSNRGEIDAS